MDLTTIKADLKTWERSFKSKNGRDPSKADIKAVPEIAEKYRVYSKARADKSSVGSSSLPPVTPSKRAAATSRQQHQQQDSFKTPSKADASVSRHSNAGTPKQQNGASAAAPIVTQFAYAPSPSRLRALAASRSFSGSPNKKGGLSASQAFDAYPEQRDSGISPPQLGKTFILPPASIAAAAADTPRTKAKRWLAGDAVSPPVKLRFNTQSGSSTGNNSGTASQASASGIAANSQGNGRAANGSTKADFWKQVEQRRSTTPATEEMDTLTQGVEEGIDNGRVVVAAEEEEDDDNFLAPSPVKPSAVAKLKIKGKQRQHLDLFAEGSVDISSTAPTNGQNKTIKHLSNTQPSTSKVPSATPITSFFTAKPRSTLLPESTSEGSSSVKRPYVPGPSKPKKRTIAATSALIPNVSENFDKIEDMDIAPIASSTALNADPHNKKNGKWTKSATIATAKISSSSSKGKQKEEDHPLQDAQERVKRPRKEVSKTAMSAEEEAMLEQERAEQNQNGDDEMYTFTEEMPVDDDYETRDLSDEYESYKPSRKRSMTPAVLAPGSREQSASMSTSASGTVPLDESLDPELVSLLSLRASPVKNRLSRLHKKQDETYRKILLEPTYVMESKRQIKGLEDLEDEEKRKRGDAKDDDRQEDWDADEDHSNKDVLETEEHSDDDWASEPEGWKDLSDGEMPEDPF